MPAYFAIIISSKVRDTSCATCVSNNNLRNNFYGNYFLVCPVKLVDLGHTLRSWSHAPWITNDKTFLAVLPETRMRRKKRKKTRMTIAKLYALYANAKNTTQVKQC